MKEYIVTLNKDADLDAFWAEIENSGNQSTTVIPCLDCVTIS